MTSLRPRVLSAGLLLLALSSLGAACGGPAEPVTPARPKVADEWLVRARQSYRAGDIDDAKVAADSALQVAPRDPEIRLIKARVALARLDYAEALKFTEGMKSSDARQIRGRAFWYQGDLEQAADELELLLRDPQIKDPWAREVAKLARQSQGRHPFAIEGGVVAMIEMPPSGPALVVPCELEGEQVLALVATAVGELIVDSNTRREPAWVNLRFGDRIEVKDVPALTQDLSPLSRQFGVPIKALLGVNLLRHMHVTFDRRGSQFVVRRDDPPPPPDAARIPLFYVRGGGMMVRGNVTTKDDQQVPFLVDSSAFYPIALEDAQWKRAGVNIANLKSDPQGPANVKVGELPLFRFGGFDLPQIPAMQGVGINDVRSALDVDVGGVVGAGLLSIFRVTFGSDGRFIWVEPDPSLAEAGPGGRRSIPPEPSRPRNPPPASTQPPAPPPAPSGSAAPPKPAPAGSAAPPQPAPSGSAAPKPGPGPAPSASGSAAPRVGVPRLELPGLKR